MNSFLEHIAARHINPLQQVQPRLSGRFETQQDFSLQDSYMGFDIEENTKTTREFKQVNSQIISNIQLNKEASSQVTDPVIKPGFVQGYNHPLDIKPLENKNVSFASLQSDEGQEKFSPVENMQDQPMNKPVKLPVVTIENQKVINEHNSINTGNTFVTTNHLLQDHLPVHLPVVGDINLPPINTATGNSIIKVSIGRIDVRAIASSAPAKTNASASQKNRMSLDDYFQKKK